MRKNLRVMVSVLAIVAMASVMFSCTKDDDELGLVGHWVFMGDVNCILTINGVKHDAMKEGLVDRSYLREFRGLFFEFQKNGSVIVGMNGEASPPAKYTVSGNKLTIKDGSFSWPMKYRMSKGDLELIWDEITMAAIGIDDSSLTGLGVDDYEFVLTFVRTD